jgi:predicted CoA-substrate-specific enzyme activase
MDKAYQNTKLYAGVDVGASRTKAVVIDAEANMVGSGVLKSGIDFQHTAERCLNMALEEAGANVNAVATCVSTGYGRKNVSQARFSKTEIACHAKGCYHIFHMAMTIIDIGGQDNKIIKLDDSGRRIGFRMNRKCAAGTGAFLEEMAQRLDVELTEMDKLARRSEHMVELGSFCTVFSATEVLEKIRDGRKIEDIAKGVYHSMLKRVLEMDSLEGTVIMTGGVVAHNPYLAEMASEMTGTKILVPPFPQLTGALGAALFALEGISSRGSQRQSAVRTHESNETL